MTRPGMMKMMMSAVLLLVCSACTATTNDTFHFPSNSMNVAGSYYSEPFDPS